MTFYVYIYRDPSKDNEPFYVGKGTGRRVKKHLSRTDSHPMTRKLKSMKEKNVEPNTEIIQAIDEDHAFFLESCLIEMFGRRDLKTGVLLNLTNGGEGLSGFKFSSESKAKIAAARTGKRHSPEALAKMSAASKNRICSDETRAKISASNKGHITSPETRAKLSVTSKNISLESRAKIAAALRGRKHSDEARAKISTARKNQTISLETRVKMSIAAKARWNKQKDST